MAVGLIAGLLAVTTVSSAPAASLERLGDGRIVITAFGESWRFEKRMPETSISFWGYWGERCDPKNSVRSTLERWLHDPKVAECLNRTIPTDAVDIPGGRGTISFGVTFVEENGLVYPGGINADELSKTSISKFERRLAILLKDPTVKGDCLFRTPGNTRQVGLRAASYR